ncbi:MAG: hypothetical protein AAFR33_02310 [Pseudomonadota bacterium]
MKIVGKGVLVGAVLALALPLTANAQSAERALSEAEIQDLLERSRAAGVMVSRDTAEFNYLGGSQEAVETQVCCEPVQEQVSTERREEVTEEFFDALTSRTVIQPLERTIVQPIERQMLQGRVEDVTEPTRFEEEILPVIVQEDPVPAVIENVIPQERTETREEVTEEFYDVVVQRDVIQPIERVTVVPVQRRIVRPRTETVTAPTRYEENILPTIVEEDPVPALQENFQPQVTENRVEEVTERVIDYVSERNVYQPLERTIIQPIERRILRPTTETITRDTIFEEEILPTRIDEEAAPAMVENVIEQVTERTVYEVEDVYIDQITRNVIQPVVVTNVQPITRRILRPQSETITQDTRFETETLPVIVEAVTVPETVVNYIPQVTENRREDVTETTFEAVTQRDIYQPIVRTMVQPVTVRRVRPQVETVTNPVRVETNRAQQIIINIGTGCNCGGAF